MANIMDVVDITMTTYPYITLYYIVITITL